MEDDDTMSYFSCYKPNEYKFALKKSKEIYKTLKKIKYPYTKELIAMVFPELIHYSQYQDGIETLVNEVLSSVTEESNIFSIGTFQMKPIFAIKIEKMLLNEPKLAKLYSKINKGGEYETRKDRRDRIKRLTDYQCQLQYLMAFIDYKVVDLQLEDEPLEIRLKYLATAYNAGFDYNKTELDRFIGLENYPLQNKLFVNYSRICLDALTVLEME